MDDKPKIPVYVYGLFDDTGIRYIGITKDIKNRLRCHLNPAIKQKNTYKENWLNKLRSEGKKPTLVVLEECDLRQWETAERAWISFGRRMGWRLTNLSDGGEGAPGQFCTPETRAKISAGLKGKPLSDYHKQRLREAWKTRPPHSPATRAKMSAALKAKGQDWVPPEVRERLRQKAIGRKASPETRAKISAVQKGKPKTPEKQAQLRTAFLGRTHSEEAKAKLRGANTGRVMSEESRRRISEAKKGSIPWNKGKGADLHRPPAAGCFDEFD